MLPMLKSRRETTDPVKHAAYADDLGGAGRIKSLRSWWDNVNEVGLLFGYFPNATKSWLVVKEQKLEEAKAIFSDTDISITTSGRKYLGKTEEMKTYQTELVEKWIKQIDTMTEIAKSEPHSVYVVFISWLSTQA